MDAERRATQQQISELEAKLTALFTGAAQQQAPALDATTVPSMKSGSKERFAALTDEAFQLAFGVSRADFVRSTLLLFFTLVHTY